MSWLHPENIEQSYINDILTNADAGLNYFTFDLIRTVEGECLSLP